MAEKVMNIYTTNEDLIQQMGKDIQTLLGLIKAMVLIQKQITNIEYRLGKLEEPVTKVTTKVTAKVTTEKKKENKKKEKEVKKEK
jgi:hypothetical protein